MAKWPGHLEPVVRQHIMVDWAERLSSWPGSKKDSDRHGVGQRLTIPLRTPPQWPTDLPPGPTSQASLSPNSAMLGTKPLTHEPLLVSFHHSDKVPATNQLGGQKGSLFQRFPSIIPCWFCCCGPEWRPNITGAKDSRVKLHSSQETEKKWPQTSREEGAEDQVSLQSHRSRICLLPCSRFLFLLPSPPMMSPNSEFISNQVSYVRTFWGTNHIQAARELWGHLTS